MVCNKCKNIGKVVMHAFSDGECMSCGETYSCSHTPPNKVCYNCSDTKNICEDCGNQIGLAPAGAIFTPEFAKYRRPYKYESVEELKQKLEEAAKAIFDEKRTPPKRIIHGYRGCITHGHINLNSLAFCDDEKCSSCRMYEKLVREALDESWKELEGQGLDEPLTEW